MEIEKGNITTLQDSFQYNSKIKFPDKSTAHIVANSLSVDEEFSELVERQITVDENSYVHIEYKFKAESLKNFKKSVKALYENMILVLETIREFEGQ